MRILEGALAEGQDRYQPGGRHTRSLVGLVAILSSGPHGRAPLRSRPCDSFILLRNEGVVDLG
jgi:hypothetical protein